MTERGFEEVLAPNLYFDPHLKAEAAKILPGEYYATGRDMVLVTMLGSCVAACIRDRSNGIGGMNHFMQPDDADQSNPLSASARYGTYAMGSVLRGFTVANVGERNSRFVLDYLETEKIRAVAQNLLDIYPRKVYFFPQTGRVLVKKLKTAHNNTAVEREKEYGARLAQSSMAGDVELFT